MALCFPMVWYNVHSEEYMPWSYQLHHLFGTVNEAEHDVIKSALRVTGLRAGEPIESSLAKFDLNHFYNGIFTPRRNKTAHAVVMFGQSQI